MQLAAGAEIVNFMTDQVHIKLRGETKKDHGLVAILRDLARVVYPTTRAELKKLEKIFEDQKSVALSELYNEFIQWEKKCLVLETAECIVPEEIYNSMIKLLGDVTCNHIRTKVISKFEVLGENTVAIDACKMYVEVKASDADEEEKPAHANPQEGVREELSGGVMGETRECWGFKKNGVCTWRNCKFMPVGHSNTAAKPKEPYTPPPSPAPRPQQQWGRGRGKGKGKGKGTADAFHTVGNVTSEIGTVSGSIHSSDSTRS